MVPSEHPPPPLRYRSRTFVRHLFSAALLGVLPVSLILLGALIELLDHTAHLGGHLIGIGQGMAGLGFYLVWVAFPLFFGLLLKVRDLEGLTSGERCFLRIAVLFFAVGMVLSLGVAWMIH